MLVSHAAAMGFREGWRVESAAKEAEKVGLVDGDAPMTWDWHLTGTLSSSCCFALQTLTL